MQHPGWARSLARWCDSADCLASYGSRYIAPPIYLRYRAMSSEFFWQMHECRTWQFIEPREWTSIFEGQDLHILHDFLSGGENFNTFSTSLCASGWQALGWG